MPTPRRTYPPEFRQQLVELVWAGRTPEEAVPGVRALGPDHSELGPPGRTRHRPAHRWPDDAGTRGADPAQARESAAEARTRDPGKSHGLVRTGDRHDPSERFGFVRDHQAVYPVATMCRLLRVSPSGFYAWRQRGPSARAQRDATLLSAIRVFHERSDRTYGAPRLLEDLREAGVRVGRKRIARLLRRAGLVGVSRRRGVRTTRRDRPRRRRPI